MIRLRRILEEPVIGPLGEECYFMTALPDYGDPFEHIPGDVSGPNYVHDDGTDLMPDEFGLIRPLREQLGVDDVRIADATDDLELWPNLRQVERSYAADGVPMCDVERRWVTASIAACQ